MPSDMFSTPLSRGVFYFELLAELVLLSFGVLWSLVSRIYLLWVAQEFFAFHIFFGVLLGQDE